MKQGSKQEGQILNNWILILVEALPGKGRILVMDDEAMVRDVVGEMLQLLGYEVAFAGDGQGAAELYRRAKEHGEPFDVVILDLTVRGGMGATRRPNDCLRLIRM
jgi:CheY-like chemotaxis protein